MRKEEALALLFTALEHCEGIPEIVTLLGKSPMELERLMEVQDMIASDDDVHHDRVMSACQAILRDE